MEDKHKLFKAHMVNLQALENSKKALLAMCGGDKKAFEHLVYCAVKNGSDSVGSYGYGTKLDKEPEFLVNLIGDLESRKILMESTRKVVNYVQPAHHIAVMAAIAHEIREKLSAYRYDSAEQREEMERERLSRRDYRYAPGSEPSKYVAKLKEAARYAASNAIDSFCISRVGVRVTTNPKMDPGYYENHSEGRRVFRVSCAYPLMKETIEAKTLGSDDATLILDIRHYQVIDDYDTWKYIGLVQKRTDGSYIVKEVRGYVAHAPVGNTSAVGDTRQRAVTTLRGRVLKSIDKKLEGN